MARKQQLLAMHAMLDHIVGEAKAAGFGIVATLAAAADEAVLDELAELNQPAKKRKERPSYRSIGAA